MCGLLFYHSLSRKLRTENFIAALQKLHHRGPDETGTWISHDQTAALGHKRLSINGGVSGQQPLFSEDKRWIAVVNGEFYNSRQSLIDEGAHFKSDSDSEYLLNSFLSKGEACLSELDGEFAFALWDQKTKTAYLARDRHGIKPLYFAQVGDQFIAASEIKALLTYGVPARWNQQYLATAGAFVTGANETCVEGVYAVQPGELFILNTNGLEVRTYIKESPLDPTLYSTSQLSFTEACVQFEHLLINAVGKRLQQGMGNACYLSSGIDSSMITAMAAESSSNIDAFSIGFDDPRLDESKTARYIAKQLGVSHHTIVATDDLLADSFEESVYHCESSVPNLNVTAKYLLSKTLATNGHKVALTGEGADESLMGYHFLKKDLLSPYKNVQEMPIKLSSHLLDVFQKMGYIPAQIMHSSYQAEVLKQLQSDKDIDINPYTSLLSKAVATGEMYKNSQRLHYKSAFQNYNLSALADRTEMANGIEGRTPFLDNELVDFIHSLPIAFKVNENIDKRILRQVAKKYHPDEISMIDKKPLIAPVSCFRESEPLSSLFDHYFYDDSNLPDFYSINKVRELYAKLRNATYPQQVKFDPVFMHLASLMVLQKHFSLAF